MLRRTRACTRRTTHMRATDGQFSIALLRDRVELLSIIRVHVIYNISRVEWFFFAFYISYTLLVHVYIHLCVHEYTRGTRRMDILCDRMTSCMHTIRPNAHTHILSYLTYLVCVYVHRAVRQFCYSLCVRIHMGYCIL